jgi:hypothetical protein
MIRIENTDDSIWAQTIGRIFHGLDEIAVGIVCTAIAIILIPIFIVLWFIKIVIYGRN